MIFLIAYGYSESVIATQRAFCYVETILFWLENRYNYGLRILSRAASFRPNMKWARKALWITITDSPVLKKEFLQQIH